jgi:chemotaxis protein MotB
MSAAAAAQKLRSDLQRLIVDEFGGRKGPGIEVRRVAGGVLIALTDQQNFEMFAIGSSEPHPKLIPVMAQLARLLEKQTGHVVIRGHTDSRPFRPGTSDNWRLSASRAQMAFQMLLRGPFDERRLERIEGRADREPLNTADGQAPENRRIEILLRTEAAP